MNTHIITRAAYGCILLCLFTLPVFAQSNAVIDDAKATFQDIFMAEMSNEADSWPIEIDFPCKSATWAEGVSIIASVKGVEDLSPRELLGGNDLVFIYLSNEGQPPGAPIKNGFYAVSLHRSADGTQSYTAQFRDKAGNTVAEAPAEVSRMVMEGATPGVDVGVEHSSPSPDLLPLYEWRIHLGYVNIDTNEVTAVWICWTEMSTLAPQRAEGQPINGVDVKPGLRQGQQLAASGVVLHEGYPNPFNPATTLSFTLPEAMPVTLRVYDLVGREVATLVSGVREAGTHEVPFDASHLASGTYLYRLEAGTFSQTKRFALVK